MLTRLRRWIGLRLLMHTQGRRPDYVHSNGSVPGAVPYYSEWFLLSFWHWRLTLTHLTSSPYRRWTGLRYVLFGWYRGHVQESPRHILLRDVGGFSGRPERAELPERGNCWLLRLRRR